jgi:hypothetical protein
MGIMSRNLFLATALSALCVYPSTPARAQDQGGESKAPEAVAPAAQEKKPKARTPAMMFALDLRQDSKKWVMGKRFATGNVIAMELVPGDQKHESWQELLTNMVIFDVPMRMYVDMWKQELSEKAPSISLIEEPVGENATLVRYRSADEQGLWRFVQGKDGVYAMAYQVKSSAMDKERLALWENLVKKTAFVDNAKK